MIQWRAMSIERRIAALAEQFAKDVLAELKGTNLDDLVQALAGARRSAPRSSAASTSGAPKVVRKAKGGRLPRRSPAELQALLDKIAAALKHGSLRAEQIQKTLGVDRKELPAVLKLGLDSKVLAKKGEKRATTYSLR